MEERSRYIIGIDLGTTNCAVAYYDTAGKKTTPQLLPLPQLNHHGLWEPLPLLPSFLYLADTKDYSESVLTPPWKKVPQEYFLGVFAKEEGSKTPTRLVHSAKSWLATPSGQRHEKILPFEAASEERRISALEATTCYLRHLKEVWNAKMAKNDPSLEMELQEVILTVPASFDEVARGITLKAAHQAGLKSLTLLEEPQAAFYSWLLHHEAHWQKVLQEGDCVLVCDIGGGTTDFTLIDVVSVGNELKFERRHVGDHLLLGGDNMDAALSFYIEKKLLEDGGEALESREWLILQHLSRKAKEYVFSQGEQSLYSLWLPGKGSSVVGGGRGAEVSYQEISTILLEGFFGLYPFEEACEIKKKVGLRTMGLVYESEPSITKHLAHFLKRSQKKQKPSHVLFNGGALKPGLFQKRIQDALDLWFPEDPPIKTLTTQSLDYAVAYGAAYCGQTRRGSGIRIGGGSSRGYYLKVETQREQPMVLTLLPKGTEEGTQYVVNSSFSLIPNTPVSFQLYTSHTRLDDQREDLVPITEEEMHPLPPLNTILQFGKKREEPLSVSLGIHLTEIGILELWLQSLTTPHRWTLEFQLRSASKDEMSLNNQTIVDETYETTYLDQAKHLLQHSFNPGNESTIIGELEKALQKPKQEWPLSFLRGLFEPLMTHAIKKHVSSAFESRFWNLLGFLLRPGSGYPLDEFRIKEVWKLILSDIKKPKSEDVLVQRWICYRRIASGLSKGQQLQLFNEIYPLLSDKKGQRSEYVYSEKLRTLASFELIDTTLKSKLGAALVNKICQGQAQSVDYWALARLGSRELLYGSFLHVVPKKTCEEWVLKLLETKKVHQESMGFVFSLLGRQTESRELNLSPEIHNRIMSYLQGLKEYKKWEDLLSHHLPFNIQQKEQLFGESLPCGLILT